jgi:nicotinate-nucleotide adenylyltransferase
VAQVGILGGTFNPPHAAHLVCAQEARDQLGLDRVLLLPAPVPPHKAVADDLGAAVRAELCGLAAREEDGWLAVCDVELERSGPSYTVDTLGVLHERTPGDELTFIVGADMAQALPTWREPREVLRRARLAVTERDGARADQLGALLAPLHDGSRIVFFTMPRLDISSTDIRARVAAGRPIRHLVPDAVAEAIAERGLYGAPRTPITEQEYT